MEIISSLIPLFVVISIIFSIINKAKKAQEKNAKKQSGNKITSSKKYQPLLEVIRQQMEEQKQTMKTPFTPPITQQKATPQMQQTRYNEGNVANSRSLEGTPTEMQRHAHNAHIGGSYNEGDALNRRTLENKPVEMQRHSHNAHVGGSYNEGDSLNRDTLEGTLIFDNMENYDSNEIAYAEKSQRKTKKPKKILQSTGEFRELKLNRNSIVNGIIMSEILNKRGGKRAIR